MGESPSGAGGLEFNEFFGKLEDMKPDDSKFWNKMRELILGSSPEELEEMKVLLNERLGRITELLNTKHEKTIEKVSGILGGIRSLIYLATVEINKARQGKSLSKKDLRGVRRELLSSLRAIKEIQSTGTERPDCSILDTCPVKGDIEFCLDCNK